MPFSANFVKVTLRDGSLLVEGRSDPDNVNRISSMEVAIDTVSHVNGGGTALPAVSVSAFEGSGDWVAEFQYENGSAPAVGTSMLIAGATILTPPQDAGGTTDSPFIWFQTLPVES